MVNKAATMSKLLSSPRKLYDCSQKLSSGKPAFIRRSFNCLYKMKVNKISTDGYNNNNSS